MKGFFIGEIARITLERACPATQVQCQVKALANKEEYNITVSVSPQGVIRAEPAFPFNKSVALPHLKHSGKAKDKWYFELGTISFESTVVALSALEPVTSASVSQEPGPVTPYSPEVAGNVRHRDTMDEIISGHRYTIQNGLNLGTPSPPPKVLNAPDEQALKSFAE